MTPAEAGFLLLGSRLGNPDRNVLSASQLRILAQRVRGMERPAQQRELCTEDLLALGYGTDMARRILALLEETDVLEHYLRRGRQQGCVPLSRMDPRYPPRLKEKLGFEAPVCLWARGDVSLLEGPGIALVGSRDLAYANRQFARAAGRQAALQGYTLISGNARGADQTAQNACLAAGGRVISIVADPLENHAPAERILYLSEDGFDEAFSSQRALSRNRCIHALGEKVLVAQSNLQKGGTWDGTVKNLRKGWSDVFCFEDGTEAARQLCRLGAEAIGPEQLNKLEALQPSQVNFFGR